MTGLSGYALQEQVDTEIVSAYAACLQQVPGVTTAPGWFKVGSFYLPKSLRAGLEVIASLSSLTLVGTARLYDPTTGVDDFVPGASVGFTGLLTKRFLSPAFSLTGDRTYFVLVQAIGASGADQFATVDTASLVGP